MGSFFSTQDSPSLEAPAASVTGKEAQLVNRQLVGQLNQHLKASPTPQRGKRDGRTYKEVCAGKETEAMSELQEPGPVWKFCEAPTVDEVSVQEHLP